MEEWGVTIGAARSAAVSPRLFEQLLERVSWAGERGPAFRPNKDRAR